MIFGAGVIVTGPGKRTKSADPCFYRVAIKNDRIIQRVPPEGPPWDTGCMGNVPSSG